TEETPSTPADAHRFPSDSLDRELDPACRASRFAPVGQRRYRWPFLPFRAFPFRPPLDEIARSQLPAARSSAVRHSAFAAPRILAMCSASAHQTSRRPPLLSTRF